MHTPACCEFRVRPCFSVPPVYVKLGSFKGSFCHQGSASAHLSVSLPAPVARKKLPQVVAAVQLVCNDPSAQVSWFGKRQCCQGGQRNPFPQDSLTRPWQQQKLLPCPRHLPVSHKGFPKRRRLPCGLEQGLITTLSPAGAEGSSGVHPGIAQLRLPELLAMGCGGAHLQRVQPELGQTGNDRAGHRGFGWCRGRAQSSCRRPCPCRAPRGRAIGASSAIAAASTGLCHGGGDVGVTWVCTWTRHPGLPARPSG